MPDYSKGKIYMITANNADDGDVYIGSTCEKLYRRMGHHKDNYRTRKTHTSRNLFEYKHEDKDADLFEKHSLSTFTDTDL